MTVPGGIGQLINQYRVVDRLGRGAMGMVYRAIDETLQREVAIKILDAELDHPEKRFQTEAIAVARLNHSGIATIYQLFEHNGHSVMVMELVRGETLDQMIERAGALPPERAADLCMQVLAALGHAHDSGIVHRDLKPANLMLSDAGTIKIMDFGIARVAGSEHLTCAGFVMGTPAYMAPEQVAGGEIDARADLYTMGIVFYRLTTAALPYNADSSFAMAQAHLTDAPTPVDLVRPGLPPWVQQIVDRALAKAPEHRFQSAAEFHRALARCLAGEPLCETRDGLTEVVPIAVRLAATSPRTPSSDGRGVAARLRHGTPVWTAVAGAVLGIGGIGMVLALDPGPTTAMRPGGNSTPPSAHEMSGRTVALAGTGPGIAPKQGVAENAADAGNPMRGRAKASGAPPAATGGAATGSDAQPLRGRAVGAGSVMAVTARGALAPAGNPEAPVAPTPAAFSDVKLLVVDGRNTKDREVLLTFANNQIAAAPDDGGAPLAAIAYQRVAKATYVYAHDPEWDASLSLGAPAEKLDVSGVFGKSRHWLVVQTKDAYAILRLDGATWFQILRTFEAHTGIKIDRPQVAGK